MTLVKKVSVSLSPDDIAFLDDLAVSGEVASRSAALQQAIRVMREQRLKDDYYEMFSSPEYAREAEEWDAISIEGLEN